MEQENSTQGGSINDGKLLIKPIKIIVPEKNPVITEITKGIKELGDRFIEYSNEIKEIDRKQYSGYFDWLSQSVSARESSVDAVRFLMKIKANCEDKIIRAKIERDVISERDNEYVISQFIIPLINRHKELIVFEKEHPSIVGKEKGQLGVIEATQEKIELIRIEEEKEPVAQNNTELFPLPKDFAKIDCLASKEIIESFFSILALEINPLLGKSYMNQEDVNELVRNNFSVFDEVPTGKYFTLNIINEQKVVIRTFVYEFFIKYALQGKGQKMKYVDFLIWNFDKFKTDNRDSLNGNMNASKKPTKYKIINTEKFKKGGKS